MHFDKFPGYVRIDLLKYYNTDWLCGKNKTVVKGRKT